MKHLPYAIALATLTAAFTASSAYADEAQPEGAATAGIESGTMLHSSSGHRIGTIYRVSPEGNPQVIIDGRLVTVPASTVSEANGKLTTSLSKRDLTRSK